MDLNDLLISSVEFLNLNIELTDKMLKQFITYKDKILEWNKNINLTAIIDEKDIILKHFIDSISILKVINLNNKNISLIDIGTGAGFPGIPVKIVNPSLKLTLVDSLNKRIKFLNHIIDSLELENVVAIHSRAEDLGKDSLFRENFDIATSRAVANMKVLCEYNLPFVKVGGKFIALKGPNINDELLEAKENIKLLGGEIEDIKYINIPKTDIKHTLIIVNKIHQTNTKYPRKSGKIK